MLIERLLDGTSIEGGLSLRQVRIDRNFICAEVCYVYAMFALQCMLDLARLVLSGYGAEGTGLYTCGRTYIYIYIYIYIQSHTQRDICI